MMSDKQANSERIGQQLAQVRARIASACARVGRKPDEITLLLATKTVPAEKLAIAARSGETLFGENRIQEGLPKHKRFAELDPTLFERTEWHFIGHLQTNKIKQVLQFVTCVQSIDRPKLVKRLDARLAELQRRLDVLIQVNTSGEASKYGVSPTQINSLVATLQAAPHLNLKGLMTIGRLGATAEEARPDFRVLRQLRDDLTAAGQLSREQNVLSMGMSGDFEIAIEEGATLVRIGTAVFGERGTPDSLYWPESHS